MDRLRGPPVLKAGNKQQTDSVRFSDGISHKKGMTMNLKNKKGKRLSTYERIDNADTSKHHGIRA